MKRLVIFAVLFIVLLAALVLSGGLWAPQSGGGPGITATANPDAPEAEAGDVYLRGAHWFGEGWAVNFWNTRLRDKAERDFATLREDGFNTVVIVVPWPGFAPSPTEGGIDPVRRERLAELIDLAGDAGLDVVLRLGYAWDSSANNPGSWHLRLWLEDDVRLAWVRHIAGLWKIVENRPHVRFAFISWEDLWAVEGLGKGSLERRLEVAESSGYRDWLRRWSSLEAVSERHGEAFARWADVPVPRRTEPAFGLFFDFIDHAWLERFFKPAQAVFPTLSMEVRIDSDPVWNAPGDLAYWHSHELAWDLPGAPWTTVYWAPAMGGENRGETLSPETAAERLAYQMRRLRAVTGDRPIFIDQFLVEDFTPGFEMNGRLARDRVPSFLDLAAPVLSEFTHGYALWTWRDYRHNAIASPDFRAADDGWGGNAQDRDAGPAFGLAAGERLELSIGIHEFHSPNGPKTASLCLHATDMEDPEADLRVVGNAPGEAAELDVSGPEERCTEVGVGPTTNVSLEALVDLKLHDVSLFAFTQPTGIRDLAGDPKPVLGAWRAFNQALSAPRPAPFEAFDDGWMGKTLTQELEKPAGPGPWALVFRTTLPADWPVQPTIAVTLNGRDLGAVSCAADREYRLEVGPGARDGDAWKARFTADRTWRPVGDERRLGCLLSGAKLVEAKGSEGGGAR